MRPILVFLLISRISANPTTPNFKSKEVKTETTDAKDPKGVVKVEESSKGLAGINVKNKGLEKEDESLKKSKGIYKYLTFYLRAGMVCFYVGYFVYQVMNFIDSLYVDTSTWHRALFLLFLKVSIPPMMAWTSVKYTYDDVKWMSKDQLKNMKDWYAPKAKGRTSVQKRASDIFFWCGALYVVLQITEARVAKLMVGAFLLYWTIFWSFYQVKTWSESRPVLLIFLLSVGWLSNMTESCECQKGEGKSCIINVELGMECKRGTKYVNNTVFRPYTEMAVLIFLAGWAFSGWDVAAKFGFTFPQLSKDHSRITSWFAFLMNDYPVNRYKFAIPKVEDANVVTSFQNYIKWFVMAILDKIVSPWFLMNQFFMSIYIACFFGFTFYYTDFQATSDWNLDTQNFWKAKMLNVFNKKVYDLERAQKRRQSRSVRDLKAKALVNFFFICKNGSKNGACYWTSARDSRMNPADMQAVYDGRLQGAPYPHIGFEADENWVRESVAHLGSSCRGIAPIKSMMPHKKWPFMAVYLGLMFLGAWIVKDVLPHLHGYDIIVMTIPFILMFALYARTFLTSLPSIRRYNTIMYLYLSIIIFGGPGLDLGPSGAYTRGLLWLVIDEPEKPKDKKKVVEDKDGKKALRAQVKDKIVDKYDKQGRLNELAGKFVANGVDDFHKEVDVELKNMEMMNEAGKQDKKD